jgi:hypothetical protein
MTSKGKQPTEDQGTDWAELLLSRFKKVDAVFQKAYDDNRSKGISKELEKQYISYTKPMQQKSYERFLNRVINPDTGEWYNIKFLRASKQISKSIDSEFEGREYPRVELYNIIRIKTKANEDRIFRCFNLVALDIKGNETAQYVNDTELERIPKIKYEQLPVQTIQAGSDFEEDGYGRSTVATITNHERMFHGTEVAPPKYLVPFSEQTIREWLEEGKNRLYDNPYQGVGGVAFSVVDESNPNRSYSVKSLEDFLDPSIDSLYTRLSSPPKTINEEDLRRLGKIFKGDDKTDNDKEHTGTPYK